MDNIFFDGTGDKKAGKFKIESEIPQEAGQRSISAKLFLRRGTVESLLKKNEHPPAMHSAMGWCKHGYINQMVKTYPACTTN